MTHKKFGDLLFMFFGTLIITLIIVATFYTARAVVTEAQGPGHKSVVQEVVQKHTNFSHTIAPGE